MDDDDALREMVSRELSLHHIYVKSLTNGSKVSEQIQNENFDMVITDIVMPEKEGIETIGEIRQINKIIPVLAISGGGRNASDLVLEMADMIGANGTLRKPFEMPVLIKKIEEILGIKIQKSK